MPHQVVLTVQTPKPTADSLRSVLGRFRYFIRCPSSLWRYSSCTREYYLRQVCAQAREAWGGLGSSADEERVSERDAAASARSFAPLTDVGETANAGNGAPMSKTGRGS